MGFLDKLWDETVAGPTPDTGLAKLRKYNSMAARPLDSTAAAAVESPPPLDQVKVCRSITIVRNNNNNNNNKNPVLKNFSVDVPGSGPASPSSSTSTTPRTPFTPGTPAETFRRWRSIKLPAATDALEGSDQRSLTVYDWIVMSALDR